MTRISVRELRHRGVSQEDIDLARTTQEAQRRAGAPLQSIAVIVGAVTPRTRRHSTDQPVGFTERALRRRGSYDQAALLLDQRALEEASPERACKARELAKGAKELSASEQIEFDFFRRNVSIAFQYHGAVFERLKKAAPSPPARDRAITTLWLIILNLKWESCDCEKTAADLAEELDCNKAHMARTLQLLEDVGAIRRVKRGRTKVITVTPEGAYRGNVNAHGKAVERYRLDVIGGGSDADR